MAGILAGCTNSHQSSAQSGTASASGSPSSAATAPVSPAASPAGPAVALEDAYARVVASVLPSVVEITNGQGLGSGIIFDDKGDVVTNDHVVGDATSFQVRLATGAASLKATLVGRYPQGDLAVIRVENANGLHPATFADSSTARVGDIVLAMGNPLGLSSSVTQGIISATGRTVTEPSTGNSPGATLPNMLQTSASINPGNSGGALVNLAGEVVGIPTLAAVDQRLGGAAPGIGFAIPSNTVTDIAKQLIQHGKVVNSHRAALGVRVVTVVGPDGQPAGAGVVDVESGGPADKAGIQAGDVITAINDTNTPTTNALTVVLAKLKPGHKATVTLLKENGSTTKVDVTLGELQAS
jgi:S1-C subfamily serine protease